MTPLPSPTFTGAMRGGNRRSNYCCSLVTTTGYFATRNAAGITEVFSACPDKDHKIAADGERTFWSCVGPVDASPAGQVTSVICPST